MPIQNVGTLIENMVVAESAGLLLDRAGSGRHLGFATAFALPALSEWRPHNQAAGMSACALRQIRESRGGTDFLDAMKACLRRFPDQGPNAALLVSLLATLRSAHLHLWANDIVDGHYANAIPSLEGIEHLVHEILPDSSPSLNVAVCTTPYPASLDDLSMRLSQWGHNVGAVLGFLDPMRYVRDVRAGPYTSSTDHRRWLTILKYRSPSLTVHFTGNSDATSLLAELHALREDLKQAGFGFWLEVRRQHYVVSVASQDIEVLNVLEARIMASWNAWCDNVPEIKSRTLDVTRSFERPEDAANKAWRPRPPARSRAVAGERQDLRRTEKVQAGDT